jgi:hypothetical protein
MPSQRSLLLDKLGAFASATCAVHCLLTGVAIGLFSVVGLDFLASTTADIVFICAALTFGTLAVWQGFRKHRSFLPMGLYVGGLLMVVISHFVLGHRSEADRSPQHQFITTALAVVGGLTLTSFHFVNMRMQHRCKICHPEDAAAVAGDSSVAPKAHA